MSAKCVSIAIRRVADNRRVMAHKLPSCGGSALPPVRPPRNHLIFSGQFNLQLIWSLHFGTILPGSYLPTATSPDFRGKVFKNLLLDGPNNLAACKFDVKRISDRRQDHSSERFQPPHLPNLQGSRMIADRLLVVTLKWYGLCPTVRC